MPIHRDEITRSQLKVLISQWASEHDIRDDEEMSFPGSSQQKGSQIQVMWNLYESGKIDSIRGLRAHYDRYAHSIKERDKGNDNTPLWFRTI